jgi:hypothetical protein
VTRALLIPLLGLLLLCGSAQADSIETIQLQHRPAAEIIPIIQPMLDAGGSVSGQGFQLFVRSSEQNLAQIRQLVETLDTAARQLLISVFQGSERDLRALAMSGGFRYQDDNADISVGSGGQTPRGAEATYSTRGAAVSGSVLSTRGRLSDNPIHQLRVGEGSAAYIETGASIPYFAGSAWLGARRPVVEAGVEYKDVTTGFYVLPRVHGEQVTMEVSPHKDALSRSRSGAIDTQRASTTVTGPLGQWIPIGGVTDQTRRSSDSIGTHLSTHSRTNDSIWIKADVVQ